MYRCVWCTHFSVCAPLPPFIIFPTGNVMKKMIKHCNSVKAFHSIFTSHALRLYMVFYQFLNLGHFKLIPCSSGDVSSFP